MAVNAKAGPMKFKRCLMPKVLFVASCSVFHEQAKRGCYEYYNYADIIRIA